MAYVGATGIWRASSHHSFCDGQDFAGVLRRRSRSHEAVETKRPLRIIEQLRASLCAQKSCRFPKDPEGWRLQRAGMIFIDENGRGRGSDCAKELDDGNG